MAKQASRLAKLTSAMKTLANLPGRYETPLGKLMYPRGGKGSPGKILNVVDRRCGVESCTGTHVSVRWPDGKLTYCCLKGCRQRKDGHYQIG